MGSVPTSLGEWIHSPWFDLGLVVWKGYRPRVRLVLAGGHASAWFSPIWRGPAPGAQRYQAGKTRSWAVLLIALSCELDDFSAVVYTKENVAAKALADQISDLSAPTQSTFGRLLGRIEEGKGEAYATKIDVRCSDRNRIISTKRILIATGVGHC